MESWSEHSGEGENEKEPSVGFTPSLEQKEYLQTEEPKKVLPTLECRPSLGHKTSALSVQSDSMLEFQDALSPADMTRPGWKSHNRLDEDDEIIIRRPDSDTATKLLFSGEWLTVDQEMKTDENASEFEMQPGANEDLTKDETVEQTLEREVNWPVSSVTSPEESNQDNSLNPEIVLAPREPIRTAEMSAETINQEEIKDSEPEVPLITDHAVTAEEAIGESPKESESHESPEHSVVNNNWPISELPAPYIDAVSEELKDKPEAMETSGETSHELVSPDLYCYLWLI